MSDWNDLKRNGAAEPAEIVVAFSQLRPVVQQLDAIVGDAPSVVESDRVLGLARVRIDGLEHQFASEVAEANQKKQEDGNRQSRPGATRERYEPLDILLEKLRARFQDNYQFSPTVGKNRTLAQVGDLHNIGVGSDGIPDAYYASSESPGLPPRKSFPGAGVQVGVADTAFLDNPWTAGAYQAAPYDRGQSDSPPTFTDGHAGFVSGLILQQAPGCTVVARRVLDDDGQATTWSVAQELLRFAHSGISVLNLSLGCFTDDDEPPLALATALDRIGPEVVVVAAAGNHNQGNGVVRPMWPAALEEVIAVGAVDLAGRSCSWSPSFDTPWLDAVAVGDDVVSAYVLGQVKVGERDKAVEEAARQAPWTEEKLHIECFDTPFAKWSGTSFAAATVSGAIAARIDPRVYSARAAWDALWHESKPVPGSSGARLIENRPLIAAAEASVSA